MESYVSRLYPEMEFMHYGLVAHKKHKFLAGSPDGVGLLRGQKYLLEYKAPHSLFSSKTEVLKAALSDKSFFLQLDKDGQPYLKRTHEYFYQVQGLLEVMDLSCCMFVVAGYESFCEVRVLRETEFFNGMLGKLQRFYFGALLPERVYAMKRKGGLRKEYVDVDMKVFCV